MSTHATIGELISLFYEEYLAAYGDEELASVATAATINDLLTQDLVEDVEEVEAA